MPSKFAIFGHPIHPMLIPIPIGLIVWALVADIVYLARDKEDIWYDIAYWSTIGAVVSGLIAALPGFGDFFTMAKDTNARDMALAHMALNLLTVGAFFVAALLMFDDGATDNGTFTVVFVLHLLGNGLVALSGWLGGEMVYHYHLAMVPDTPDLQRAEQQRHELPRTGRPQTRGR